MPAAGVRAGNLIGGLSPTSFRGTGWSRIRQILFMPPVDETGLMQRLGMAAVACPQMSATAFSARIRRLDRLLSTKEANGLVNIITTSASSSNKRRSSSAYVDVVQLHADLKTRFGMRTRDGSRVKSSFGAGSSALGKSAVVERVKAKIIEKGGRNGLHSLRRIMKLMDDSGDMCLTSDELRTGLRDQMGIVLTHNDVDELFVHFDKDKSGTISFDELLRGISGELNDRRKRIVLKAFKVLDKSGDGMITIEDIEESYNVDQHPDVVNSRRTREDVLEEFLSQWDTIEKDGVVTRDEFMEYYRNISASIPGDDYFELMIRNAWHISGGEGACANTTCRRVLVTHADGRQTVEEIEDDLGIAGDDEEEMKRNLARRGIHGVRNIQTHGNFEANSRKAKMRTKQKESQRTRLRKARVPQSKFGNLVNKMSREDEVYVRKMAAHRMQGVFRVHKAKKIALQERRKKEREKEERSKVVMERHAAKQRLKRNSNTKWWIYDSSTTAGKGVNKSSKKET